MQTWLIGLFTLYGLTIAWTQLRFWYYHPYPKEPVHYYLYTLNSQAKIEWVVRSLTQWSKLEGREFHFYIIDMGSNDDTLNIIRTFRRQGIRIHDVDAPRPSDEESKKLTIFIDLRERCYPCEFKTILTSDWTL